MQSAMRLDIGQDADQIIAMHIVSYSEARDNLKAVIDKAVNDRAPIAIHRQRGEDAVLISLSEWNSMVETAHLLSTPANTRHLMDGIRELDAGRGEEHELIKP